MKQRLSKQSKQEEAQQAHVSQEGQQNTGMEFDSVEEMIRYDLSQTAVPLEIGERLARDLALEQHAEARRSWWKRLFSSHKREPLP